MTDQPTPSSLRERIKQLSLIKDIAKTPDNVVLVTVDDIIELYYQLAPHSMQKLDEAKADRQRLADDILAEFPEPYDTKNTKLGDGFEHDVGYNAGIRDCRQAVQRCVRGEDSDGKAA